MNIILNALGTSFSPFALLLNIIGVGLGIVFGAMPGLNGVVGVALLLPITYSLSPGLGLLMLGGLYMGSTYGGSISAILLNCPGTGEAACTAMNGNPLARQGKSSEALTYSVLSSGFGGFFGVLIMMLFTPILAKVALKFGPPELFLVCLSGLAVVGALMGSNVYKGFFAVAFGLILSTVGMDNTSCNYRFTFESMNLQSGLSLIPVSVGFFAISEMLNLLYEKSNLENVTTNEVSKFNPLKAVKETLSRWKIILKSSILGTLIGILPGTGGAIASFIAYGEARRTSKESELFGKGSIDGIVAPESANNAAVGGSFVPLLSLGIPGSATSAIIFGAITIHGLIPGPKLFVEHGDVVYTMMFGLLISCILMIVLGFSGVKLFSKILKVNTKYIIPAVLIFSIIGAYSARNSLFDILIAICFGIIGLIFKRLDVPIAPSVLGMILGGMAEKNLRQSIIIATAKDLNIISYILIRPIALILLVLLILLIYGNIKVALKNTKK